MERTVSRHEEDRDTQESGLPACTLLATVTQVTGQEETPGEGQPWKLALRGGSNAFTCSLPSLGLFYLSA